MKKIFTLISMALVAMSVNAQETTQVFSVGNGDFNVTNAAQAIQVKDGKKACANVAILSSPYPDDMYQFDKYDATNKVNIYDETQPINPWSLEGNAESNTSIAALQEGFTSYLKGKGNPFITENFEWEYDSDKSRMKLKDVNTTNTAYTADCGKLPVRGMYIEITPIVNGTVKMGVYINKNNHELFIIDESTKTPIANDKVSVNFYYQNNGWTFDDNGTTVSNVTGTLPADYIIQHTNGYTQNRPALGTISFPVEAGKKYMIMNPKSQVGFYGFTYTYDKAAFDTADPLPEPQLPTAIETVKNIEKAINANAPVYNLAGQKVDKSQKGILIQNGRKFVNK